MRAPRKTTTERITAKIRKDRAHDRYVVRTYSLAPGQYEEMLNEQDGRCAICRKRPQNRYLAVDHSHETGAVRALLCYFCNSSIGTFEYSADTARRASEYLTNIAQALGSQTLHPPLVESSRQEGPL